MNDYIEAGIQVRLEDSDEFGSIHTVFNTFSDVTDEFILDKEKWLRINGYIDRADLLSEKWAAVDLFNGGQVLTPMSNVKFQ